MTATASTDTAAEPQTRGFEAEVSRLLDIVANALYSNKENFLRELISNASDACDKRRYAALTDAKLSPPGGEYRVILSADKAARTLTIADNGIGMDRDDLIANLGTIARSGTAAFMEQMKAGTGAGQDDKVALIGQFGVGFYSAFMIADRVEVFSRKAGTPQGWVWSSDGKGTYTVAEATDVEEGARLVLHLKPGEDEYLEPMRLRTIVRTYSDHIGLPVVLSDGGRDETLNEASALWTRPKSEINEQQYAEFYRHVSHGFDTPWQTLHFRAEGVIEYTGLLFIPTQRPFDLFNPDRKNRVKLYVRRVFITDDCPELLPQWLRFLRGVVDSEDLPLNISREMLQHNPTLAKIRAGLVKRVLDSLKKSAADDPEGYAKFWEAFGAVVKEGLYEDFAHREQLLDRALFRSTRGEEWVTLDSYVAAMPEAQDAIYYITAETMEAARRSPQLEGFRARGIEVLLLTDPVDDFWIQAVPGYKDKPFRSVTRSGSDLSKFKTTKADVAEGAETAGEESAGEGGDANTAGIDGLVALLKLKLKDSVKDVRRSDRLTESPVCLVADEGEMDMHMERILRHHRQVDSETKRILEINPAHGLIRAMAAAMGEGRHGDLEEAGQILLDQARILEGETPADPAAFSARLSKLLQRCFTA